MTSATAPCPYCKCNSKNMYSKYTECNLLGLPWELVDDDDYEVSGQ